MRVLLGLALVVATLVGSDLLAGLPVVGYVNLPAMVLVLGGPCAAAIISYSWRELGQAAIFVSKSLMADDKRARETRTALVAIAAAQRAGRPQDIVRVAEGSHATLVRDAALLVLKRYDERTLRELFLGQAQALMTRIKRAEDVFNGLARLSPAFGLIGTILGFIALLRHLDDPSQLGPGLAMALMATLYGITASYCLYHPLAKSLGAYGRRTYEQARAIELALILVLQERAGAEIEALFASAETRSASEAPRAVAGEA
jgi:chemotaxis protein MotA